MLKTLFFFCLVGHYRAVHRGSYFVEMRTTEARQLLPDAWGFICPVHTPDGSPCGLLNHLTMNCIVSGAPDTKLVDNIPKVLADLGMAPINSGKIDYKKYYVVILEGKIIGHVAMNDSKRIADRLRLLKIDGAQVPNLLEVVLVPKKTVILFFLNQISYYNVVNKFK